jgi:putative FmdB family regulatory protein
MPIYEYYCSQCNKVHEVLQRLSEASLTQCPVCGREGLQKIISRSAFQLKGSGWYVTDFKDKKTNKPDSKTEENKTETKAEAAASDASDKKSGPDVANA